jgi:hypothetical protein
MIRKILQIVPFLAVLGLAVPVSALDVPLTYTRCDQGTEESLARESIYLADNGQLPPGEWKLPSLVSKAPLYALVKLAGQDRLMVFDQAKPEDSFYNRVYFDANGNRDLTDDSVISGSVERTGPLTEAEFSPIDLTITVDGKQLNYSMVPEATRFSPGAIIGFALRVLSADIDRPMIRLRANCAYVGEFDLDGRHYRVTLLDENVNGRFDDHLKVLPPSPDDTQVSSSGDSISIKVATDGAAIRTYQALGDLLVLDRTLFEVSLRVGEGKMTLSPYGGEIASARLPEGFETLTLYTDEANPKGVMMYRPAQTIPLPCGSYRLLQYDLFRDDEQGDRWTLSAAGAKDSAPFIAAKGGETALVCGEPFSPVVTVHGGTLKRSFFGGTSAQLDMVTKGTGNEEVTDVSHASGHNTRLPLSELDPGSPREPRYKVTKSDGEIVSEGAFRYG